MVNDLMGTLAPALKLKLRLNWHLTAKCLIVIRLLNNTYPMEYVHTLHR